MFSGHFALTSLSLDYLRTQDIYDKEPSLWILLSPRIRG